MEYGGVKVSPPQQPSIVIVMSKVVDTPECATRIKVLDQVICPKMASLSPLETVITHELTPHGRRLWGDRKPTRQLVP